MQHNTLGQFTALEPNLSMTDDLAYIIGVYFGDAWIEKQKMKNYGFGYTIKLEVIDKDFRDAFALALKKIGVHPTIYVRTRKSGPYVGHLSHGVKARSVRLYQYLAPLSTESLNRLLIEPAHKKAFLKGFFDSEGHAGKHSLQFANSDYPLIMLVARLLASLGIYPNHIYGFPSPSQHLNWLPKYQIVLNKEEARMFLQSVGTSIERKRKNYGA